MATAQETARVVIPLTAGLIGGPYAYMGATILSAYMFPPKFEKPKKYADLGLNSSAIDSPQTIVYGTNRVNGGYIYEGALTTEAIRSNGKD